MSWAIFLVWAPKVMAGESRSLFGCSGPGSTRLVPSCYPQFGMMRPLGQPGSSISNPQRLAATTELAGARGEIVICLSLHPAGIFLRRWPRFLRRLGPWDRVSAPLLIVEGAWLREGCAAISTLKQKYLNFRAKGE